MTRDGQRIDQIQNGISTLEDTLVYCSSELLDSHCFDRLCFYQQFHFLLRCYFLCLNSKVKCLQGMRMGSISHRSRSESG